MTLQLAAEPLPDQIQACGKGLDRRAVADDHHLRGLRAALHHHLQIARKSQMGLVGVAGHSSIDQRPADDGRRAVDQGMLNAAVGDVDHAVGIELEQPHFGRAQAAADGETRAVAKPGGCPGNHRYFRQAMGARQRIERAACGRSDAVLTEPRTAGARRAVWAKRQCTRVCGMPRPPQSLHTLKFHELCRRRPQVIAVQERFERIRVVEGQRLDFCVYSRFVEKRNRHPLAARADDAMFGRLDAPIAPALQYLAKIDRQGALDWRHIEPLAIQMMGLQAADIVLRQQREKSGVDVRRSHDVFASTMAGDP